VIVSLTRGSGPGTWRGPLERWTHRGSARTDPRASPELMSALRKERRSLAEGNRSVRRLLLIAVAAALALLFGSAFVVQAAASRAMLRAVGMRDEDFRKPLIAVASSWNEVTPCNLHLDKLADRAKAGVREAGGYPLEFTTIAVSDGISMGTEGMRASLISRE